MDRNNRFCTLKGHQENNISHFCSFSNCDYSRWVCSECLAEEIHKHGFNNNFHLKNKKQFQEYMMTILDEAQNKSIQQSFYVLKHVKIIIKELQIYPKSYKIQQIHFSKQLRSIIVNIQRLILGKQFNLNEEEINQIFKILKKQQEPYIDLNLIQYQLDQGPIIQNQIKEQFLLMQQHYLRINSDIVNYNIGEIQPNSYGPQWNINSVVISPDEKKIVCVNQCQIICYNIDNYQLQKFKTFPNYYFGEVVFTVCQFSNDSQKLYAGCKQGQLIIFDYQFQSVQKIQCEFYHLIQIANISNEILLISGGFGKLLKINIQNSQKLFQIDYGCSNFVYHKSKDIIISIEENKMYFWNGIKGNLLFQKEDSSQYKFISIQLIKEEKQLLTLDFDGVLKIWLIQWEKNDLVTLNFFQDLENQIEAAYQINDKKILVMKTQGNQILNQKFDTLQKFQTYEKSNLKVKHINCMYAISISIIAIIEFTDNGQTLFFSESK